MIPFAPTIKKNSFLATEKQKNIILDFVDYFRLNLPNGNGSYLATFDFSKIDFYFCKEFFYKNYTVYGSWSPLYFDSIFIIASLYNQKLLQDFKQTEIYKKYNLTDDISKIKVRAPSYYPDEDDDSNQNIHHILSTWTSYISDKIMYNKDRFTMGTTVSKYFIKDLNTYSFIRDLLEKQYIITFLHQIYHKYQFSAAWYMPIIYIANHFISQFFGYQLACKMPWTLQGDVRVVVDNENTRNMTDIMLDTFFKLPGFYEYINKLEFHTYTPEQIQLYGQKWSQQMCQLRRQQYIEHFTKRQAKLVLDILKKYDVLQDQFLKQLQNFIETNK